MSPLPRPPVCLAAWASTRARESSPATRTRVFGETRETSRRGASRRPPRSRFSGPSRTSLCARSRTRDLTARSSSGAHRLSARVSAECPSEWAAATRAQRRESRRRRGKKKKKSHSFEAAPLRGGRKRRRRGWTSPPAAGPRCSGTRGRDEGGRRTRGRPPGRKTIFIPDDRAIAKPEERRFCSSRHSDEMMPQVLEKICCCGAVQRPSRHSRPRACQGQARARAVPVRQRRPPGGAPAGGVSLRHPLQLEPPRALPSSAKARGFFCRERAHPLVRSGARPPRLESEPPRLR